MADVKYWLFLGVPGTADTKLYYRTYAIITLTWQELAMCLRVSERTRLPLFAFRKQFFAAGKFSDERLPEAPVFVYACPADVGVRRPQVTSGISMAVSWTGLLLPAIKGLHS